MTVNCRLPAAHRTASKRCVQFVKRILITHVIDFVGNIKNGEVRHGTPCKTAVEMMALGRDSRRLGPCGQK